MKVLFDTNVYVAEALLGEFTGAVLDATFRYGGRVYTCDRILDEIERVLADDLEFSGRLAKLARQRCARRAIRISARPSRHQVPDDPDDSPILQAAIDAGVDYLVTSDQHLLVLNPYHGVRILSITDYHRMLVEAGLI
jgi:putative PIN family toxin of toxin-antitoxin system